MRIALYGPTALAALMTTTAIRPVEAPTQVVLRDSLPTDEALAYVRERLPQLPRTVHLLTSRWERVLGSEAVLHRLSAELPAGALVGIGDGLYAASPELCLAQLSRTATDQELIFYGSLLCSPFALDAQSGTGLRERTPLTSPTALRRFLLECPGLRGATRLRRCLSHFSEGAASPPEAFLRMVLCLPHRLGGFGLTDAVANHRVYLGKRTRKLAAGRRTLVPDLCWPSHRVGIEYDADSVHLTSRQAMLDSTKRLALEAEGFKVITVTSLQIGNRRQMENIAREASRHLGRRMRIRCNRFPEQQRRLFEVEWSLRSLFAQEELRSEGKTAFSDNLPEEKGAPSGNLPEGKGAFSDRSLERTPSF